MITRLGPPFRSVDLEEPLVTVVAVADLALESLVTALFETHPQLDQQSYLHPDAWDIELRHAQLALSLARALQHTLGDYAAVLAERLERKRNDDLPF